MNLLFPVPDDAMLERLRRTVDVLELLRQIEKHVPPERHDALIDVRRAVCGEQYTQAAALMAGLLSSMGRPCTELVVVLLHLMLAADMPDAAERIARLFQASGPEPSARARFTG